MSLAEHLRDKMVPLVISCVLGVLIGTLFFNLKGSPEGVTVRIRPALIYTLQEDYTGVRSLVVASAEGSGSFKMRLQKYFTVKYSPGSVNFRIIG